MWVEKTRNRLPIQTRTIFIFCKNFSNSEVKQKYRDNAQKHYPTEIENFKNRL